MATWWNIRQEYEVIVVSDIESGELDPYDDDAVDEYAWLNADGSQYVIYNHSAREAWISGADGYEDEASDLGPFDSIQEWITATVFIALRAHILEVIDTYKTDHPKNEEEGDEG